MGAIALPILLSAAGGIAAQTFFGAKTPAAPQASATPAPKTNEAANTQRANDAAKLNADKAAMAGGANSTLLTGPVGLGQVDEKNKSTTTLLGY